MPDISIDVELKTGLMSFTSPGLKKRGSLLKKFRE